MVSSTRGYELHDRNARGISLTCEELAELNAWYAEMDRQEAQLFAANALPPLPELLRKVSETEERIRQLQKDIALKRAENEKLEQEIRLLKARKSHAELAA